MNLNYAERSEGCKYAEEARKSLETAKLGGRMLPHMWGEVKLSSGRRIVWELTSCKSSLLGKGNLAYHWKKNGWIKTNRGDKEFCYWCLSTYYYDKNDQCWGMFNPTVIKGENRINFKNMLEPTEINAIYLLTKMIQMAEEAGA